MTGPLALIVNPAAGGGRTLRALPAVIAALRGLGLEHSVAHTSSLEHAARLARAAAASGAVAVAFGGDGLVGAVAGGLSGTGALLGILPGGRGNDLARVLGIPRDPVRACACLWGGRPRPLDLGAVDGRPFCGIACAGFDSEANAVANAARRMPGRLVYVYGALRVLGSWRAARFELDLDGEALRFSGWSVAAASSRSYGGGMLLAPGASLDDGLLDVVCVADMARARFLSQFPRVFSGTHVDAPEITVRRAREVRIAADRPFAVYADGDPAGHLPVTIRALPHALDVLVPA